ncbi:MAG: N-carbamoyl-D-amino-acid hydrolase [Planctomycetota bacterium]|nr:N-carbamoyl-D-amino-acid hydrolase [Planctomycetota bacterium]
MSRIVMVAAAQSGPVPRNESRKDTVERLLAMMRKAHRQGSDLVVFTECALTPFFPHWYMDDPREVDQYFEMEMPSEQTEVLFKEAARLKIGFQLGYAERVEKDRTVRYYNSSILVNKEGQIVGNFRKIHLPGYNEIQPDHPFQNLEKYYFDVGDLGFRTWRSFGGVVGMCICNDRRWPETYRVLGLRGAELILLGYNTPCHNPQFPEMDSLVSFHNLLCLQSGAYQNGSWVIAVAKAGTEEGVAQLGQSCIIAPSGEVVAMCHTLSDEVIVHSCDLDATLPYKEGIFNFEKNRHIQSYGPITQQTKSTPPEH